MEKEIWKDVNDYNGLYQISNLGNVKSIHYRHTNVEKILKPYIKEDGYVVVCLTKNRRIKWHRVHRLVAEAFINNPDNLPEVNHKDENKLNNRVDNLEWCTSSYNKNYGTRNYKCMHTRRHSSKMCRNSVQFIRQQEKLLDSWI